MSHRGRVLYAHTPAGDQREWHPLVDHLNDVAALACKFGSKFGAEDICEVLGISHDLGKASKGFQQYLASCASSTPVASVPHSAPGAAAVSGVLGAFVLAILGHHAGLPDLGEAKSLLARADADAVGSAEELLGLLKPNFQRPSLPSSIQSEVEQELFLRLCFSALVDADYLDTEAHFNPHLHELSGAWAPLAEYAVKLRGHLESLRVEAAPTRLNEIRLEILAKCLEAANGPTGAYRLTVPTGGGKTLSGLAFSLEHAVFHDLDRVIVAVPYTSIIDQTAKVYSAIFGSDSVLEHHSGSEICTEQGQTPEDIRRRLAAQNWDCPLVVTTTVQLFESLLSNRPSRCRKLHNITRSVIVLDEVQALPTELLQPILDVLRQLVEHYGCTVIFCTATQPDFKRLADENSDLTVLADAREIIEKPDPYFSQLKRVNYIDRKEPIPLTVLANEITERRQILCILNSRRDAVNLLNACLGQGSADLFHLSTLMCPQHRREVLDVVRSRLQAGQAVRLVATQVVEAGVDIDFPVVYRDLGPLDRIIQAAGRCNREGRLEGFGECTIIRLADSHVPAGHYRTATDLTRTLLAEYGENIDDPHVLQTYYTDLFKFGATDSRPLGASETFQDLRKQLMYKTVAKHFRLINEETSTLLIEKKVPADLLESYGRISPRVWHRRTMHYSVSVGCWQLEKMLKENLASPHESGLYLYTGSYSDLYGIGAGKNYASDELMA